MAKDMLPIKAFLKQVEKRLAHCSSADLRSILYQMTVSLPPHERRHFLEKLQPTVPEHNVLEETLQTDALLLDIEEMTKEIQEQARHGDEYERDDDHWGGHGGWDDEDSLGPYADFVEPIAALFDRADGVFDSGNFQLARQAYDRLFALCDMQDDYGRGVSVSDLTTVDLAKTHARYLRAVYETATLQDCPGVLFTEMKRLHGHNGRQPPRLHDLLHILRRKLPDWDAFLASWIHLLRSKNKNEADALLREAIQLQGGVKALAEFARHEGKRRPRAYLDWVAALRAQGRPKDALRAAEEALAHLPRHLPLRAAIADHLGEAAKQLGNNPKLQEARWQAFAAWPSLPRLLDVLDATPAKQRGQRLADAQKHLKDYLRRDARRAPQAWDPLEDDDCGHEALISAQVLAHAYLLDGRWDAARELAGRPQPRGWTSGDDPQCLIVPAFLVLVLGRTTRLPPYLAALWKQALSADTLASYGPTDGSDTNRLERAYGQLIKDASVTPDEAGALLFWCVKIIEQRVEAVVKNSRRGSYREAAQLVAAGVEVFQARGKDAEGAALVGHLREAFPRHRAFQEELTRALGKAKGR